jgi:carboxypeptidase family protein
MRRCSAALVCATALALLGWACSSSSSSAPAPSTTTATVSGTVTEETTHSPLPNASVRVEDIMGAQSSTTNSNGEYSISGVAKGPIVVTASLTGFMAGARAVTIVGDTRVDITMSLRRPSVLQGR